MDPITITSQISKFTKQILDGCQGPYRNRREVGATRSREYMAVAFAGVQHVVVNVYDV